MVLPLACLKKGFAQGSPHFLAIWATQGASVDISTRDLTRRSSIILRSGYGAY